MKREAHESTNQLLYGNATRQPHDLLATVSRIFQRCQPHDLLATVNRIFQRWILTPARELPLDLPDACSVTPPQPFERWIWSIAFLISGWARTCHSTVQPGVRPARRPPRCDLVGDDDESSAATHVDAAATATDVAVPCLGVPAKAGRYAFLGVGVGGDSVARNFENLWRFCFFLNLWIIWHIFLCV